MFLPCLRSCSAGFPSASIRILFAFACVALPAAFGALPTAASESPVDFRREVQPILSEHCYHCHAVDESTREGGLRLDLREAALLGGVSDGPAIVPGDPEASAMLARVTSHDRSDVMPPPREKKPLSPEQIDILSRWIAEGAEYAGHWAFEGPEKPEPPAPADGAAEVPAHPIDALVAARLAEEGLAPASRAEPWELVRRLYLDLTGLPPSPEEVAAFEADPSEEAWAALVEQLLASPAYAERWAQVWLDAARYSDSNGFEKDLPRDQWAWRDWVIAAIRDDLPYDRFVIEQVAGDLLPDATQDQIVATGFLRNGMINEEGAIVPEQFRLEGLFDRMDCLGKAVLGLSLQCAQCHTHKFDPITHDEYFGMFAFLNNGYEAQSWVYDEAQRKEIDAVREGIAKIDERLREQRPEWESELEAWIETVRAAQAPWMVLSADRLMTRSGLNHPVQQDDGSILTLGHPSESSEHLVLATPDRLGVTGLRLEALKDGDLPFGGPGHSLWGTWALSELEAHAKGPEDEDWRPLPFANATADFSESERRIEETFQSARDPERDRRVGPVDFLIDGDMQTAWRADRGPGRRNAESVAVLQFAEPVDFPPGTELRLTIHMKHGGSGNGRNGRLTTMLGRMRISLTDAPDPQTPPVAYAAQLAMEIPAPQRDEAEQAALFAAWREALPEAKALNEEAAKLWQRYPAEGKTSVLHLAERESERSRATRLLGRGEWDQPEHEVPPHVPAALHPLRPRGGAPSPEVEPASLAESDRAPSTDPAASAPDRLDFARWLVDPASPLAARVAVNRIWQTLFGAGLVETSEDFGVRAPLPEHLPLLDWLAVEFMERGWSQKELLRLVLASETYRRSARLSPELAARDPDNRLLARGPRFRAPAETVRDIALSAAGLLHEQVGGPSQFPPVPQSVLDYNFFPVAYWEPPSDEQRYRRSLYLFRKRSMPDPVLSVFDAPNADASCVRRPVSNTPLAALAGLNETVFVEAAQGLAQRVLREAPGDDEGARIDLAYRLCVGRGADESEIATVKALLAETRERLLAGELAANEIAFSELTRVQALPPRATPVDLAAWTVAARVLLNLDETLTKP